MRVNSPVPSDVFAAAARFSLPTSLVGGRCVSARSRLFEVGGFARSRPEFWL